MSESSLHLELDSTITRITLTREAKHNAFDDHLIEALTQAFQKLHESPPRLLLLASQGKSFSAGADIDWMRKSSDLDFSQNEKSALVMAKMFELLDQLPCPVLTRVQGACIGGGVGLVAASDIVVASQPGLFALSEVRLGILPAVIGPYVVRKIGWSRARELFLSGRRFKADEALTMGLVHSICSSDELDTQIEKYSEELLAGSPQAQSQIKSFLRHLEPVLDRESSEVNAFTAKEIAQARASEDGKAGLSAFLNKSLPPWNISDKEGAS